jgi:hypothetical protein
MNEQMLTERFDAAVRDEPALGFDPAAIGPGVRQRRARVRAMTLAGAGVVAVAVVAVVVAGTPAPGPAGIAVSPARPSPATSVKPPVKPPLTILPGSAGDPSWPPAGTRPTELDDATASSLRDDAVEHLSTVLPQVVPGAVVHHDPDDGVTGPASNGFLNGDTSGRMQDGYSAGFLVRTGDKITSVGVAVLAAREVVVPFRLSQVCSGGTITSCARHKLSDGGTLVVRRETKGDIPSIQVLAFRHDGVMVSTDCRAPYGSAPGTGVLMTEAQLTTLVLDPEFGLG